ncbi:MAG: hypothetical protein AB2689_28895 [Candidatus Thiodiazotropha taylori]
MAAHAEFAAVLGIDQHLLNDSLRRAYLVNIITNRFAFTAGIAGLIEYSFDLFSDAPVVQLSEVFERDFLVSIRAWGDMTVSTAGPTRSVEITTTMRIPHVITINNDTKKLAFELNNDNLTVTSFKVVVLQGDDFPDSIHALHETDVFLNMVAEGIREQIGDLNESLPQFDISFLETFLVLPHADAELPVELLATARSLNGVLNIGIDLLQGTYGTVGNPQDFEDINQGLSFGIASNSDIWLLVLEADILEGDDNAGRIGIRQQIQNAGAVLDDFTMTMGSGFIRIEISASNDYGSVESTFDVVPKLRRPATYTDLGDDELGYPNVISTPARDELWFDIENVNVSLNVVWWITLLEVVSGILTVGIVAMIVEAFKDMFQRNIEASLYQDNNLSFKLGDLDGRIERFEFHTDSTNIGISIATEYHTPLIYPSWSEPRPIYYTIIDVDERLLDRELRFSVRLPHTAHINDPYLRIAWDVRRTDNNVSILTVDGRESEIALPGLPTASNLIIRCRVYRILWNPPIEIFQGNFTVYFRDRIDQSHPYVRWRHYVAVPDVSVDAQGNSTTEGYHVKFRHSKIHRTDFPERCRMVSRYSLNTPNGFRPPPWRPPEIQYLDALPFSEQEIITRRDELCDYCFFGGPTSITVKHLPNQS